MGNNAKNTVGLKLIQLSSDTYMIKHQCLLAEMKTVTIGENMLIVYSNIIDPLIYSAKLLDLWQQGDVLYLKFWNYHKSKSELHAQDLTTEDCLFSFVSIPFISKLVEIMTGKCKPESCMESKQTVSEPVQTKPSNDKLKSKHGLPQPFYNSSGKMIMKYISASEIMLDLPFILTQNKKLKLNMPYLKTESKLSGNGITAIRLLDLEAFDGIVQLVIQELKTKNIYNIDWNMDYDGSYWMWSISDLSTHLKRTESK